MSSGKKRPARAKPQPKGAPADAALVDRLRRAVGAHQLRTGQTITWRELGEVVGLTTSSMNDVLRLARRVTIPEAEAWARKLGVEFAWLAIGEGPMMRLSPDEANQFGAHRARESAAESLARLDEQRQRERERERQEAEQRGPRRHRGDRA